ncbi:hypothetical protein [Aestuariicoccus sp. MJ-SS9]|uniref:hypothetical protein n=1 Tax=Aestuariicoccus sp. MJ-SS9 TaxID=3079855 RepID=UPI002909797C|nr:hypothetical protein [Aestuariicoccus sp. MJ-SS9]MDU8911449.1 hypothetical protein [Aestuariicoccus sp. MJ-SS9]
MKRKAFAFYGLLLVGGWFLGGYLKDLTVPEMRPMNEPMIHRIVMTAFVAFVVLAAIPFVPGAEIGFALLLLFGGQVAPLVYLGMVGALVVSFLCARLVPAPLLACGLQQLGLTKAAAFIIELDSAAPHERADRLSLILPPALGRRLHRYRHLLLAIALNTPGNSLLGGGGGLAFMAGASRLYGFGTYLATIVCAVAPVPLVFFFT